MEKKILILISLILMGCTPAVTEPVLVDSFFSGGAFLDANKNGILDPEDLPVMSATFIVTLKNGTEFGATTDKTGHAFVTIPGRVEYPVTVRMEAPKDGSLNPVDPAGITLTDATSGTTKFLFKSE